MFHVEQQNLLPELPVSVSAVGAFVRTGVTAGRHGTLNAGERGEREMAYPEHKVRPLVHRDFFAYPLDDPLFEMKAGKTAFGTHLTL